MIQTIDTQTFGMAKHAARLGPNHGYRIDGDIASLHAEIALELENNTQAQWALQLWACDNPFDGGALSGVKIAEAALPLPGSQAIEPQRLDAQTYASWGVDLLKYDDCNGSMDAESQFRTMQAALLATGRPMLFGIRTNSFAEYLPSIHENCSSNGNLMPPTSR